MSSPLTPQFLPGPEDLANAYWAEHPGLEERVPREQAADRGFDEWHKLPTPEQDGYIRRGRLRAAEPEPETFTVVEEIYGSAVEVEYRVIDQAFARHWDAARVLAEIGHATWIVRRARHFPTVLGAAPRARSSHSGRPGHRHGASSSTSSADPGDSDPGGLPQGDGDDQPGGPGEHDQAPGVLVATEALS